MEEIDEEFDSEPCGMPPGKLPGQRQRKNSGPSCSKKVRVKKIFFIVNESFA
jgi:hypothetical protein